MNKALIQPAVQLLANVLPGAIVILDESGRILWWNTAANQLLDITKHHRYQPIQALIQLPEPEDLEATSNQEAFEIETHHDKTYRLSVTLIPYIDHHYLLVAQDLTHVYELEQLRQDFIANASHEMRTPLTVVHGYLETLLDHPCAKDDAIHRIFQQMFQQTKRMQTLVNDLLLLSRLQGENAREKEYAAINVHSLLNNLCQEARAFSGSKQHQIHLEVDDSLTLYGLADELRSAFSNIIINAVKYTPEQGHIFVSWSRHNQRPTFKVEDTGIGIEKEHIPRLTERFYRVDRARSRASGGTGLGLAIVKHVLLRHQAQLEIASVPGEGSTFICRFPAGTYSVT